MHESITLKVPEHIKKYKNNTENVSIDKNIVRTIEFLWKAGIATLGSCCGEGRDETDQRPTLILPEKYTNGDIDKIRLMIKEFGDYRHWMIAQWRCVEIGEYIKPKRPFFKSKDVL